MAQISSKAFNDKERAILLKGWKILSFNLFSRACQKLVFSPILPRPSAE